MPIESKAIHHFSTINNNETLPIQLKAIGFKIKSQAIYKLNDLSERLDDKFRHLQLKTDIQLLRNKLECTGRIRIK